MESKQTEKYTADGKSPVLEVIELLEQNGFRVFEAREETLDPDAGMIELRVASKKSKLGRRYIG